MPDGAQLVVSGNFHVAVTYEQLTGYVVHVDAYSTWGHNNHVMEYVRTDHVSSDAFNLASEELGQFLSAFKDDLVHRIT